MATTAGAQRSSCWRTSCAYDCGTGKQPMLVLPVVALGQLVEHRSRMQWIALGVLAQPGAPLPVSSRRPAPRPAPRRGRARAVRPAAPGPSAPRRASATPRAAPPRCRAPASSEQHRAAREAARREQQGPQRLGVDQMRFVDDDHRLRVTGGGGHQLEQLHPDRHVMTGLQRARAEARLAQQLIGHRERERAPRTRRRWRAAAGCRAAARRTARPAWSCRFPPRPR